MSKAIVAFGSNLGERLLNLVRAYKSLDNLIDCRIVDISDIFESKPAETTMAQPDYLNCAVLLEVGLSPLCLMGALLGIESAMGRVRTVKNASRIIDLDLIAYEGCQLSERELVLPHPRVQNRPFVALPVLQLVENLNSFGINRQELCLDTEELRLHTKKEEFLREAYNTSLY